MTPRATSKDLRLPLYVAIGALAGVAYAVFDGIAESRLRDGTLTGWMAQVHAIVDHASPIVVGALLGICLHYLRLRARLSTAEAAAAEDRARLQKVERDQAVWVLAAAVLHELNNPLHAIGLLVDELSESDEDAARRADLLRRARNHIDRARGHLDTLRSMPTGGEPELEGVALDRLVAAMAGDRRAKIGLAELVVEAAPEASLTAVADPTYVRVILENLLDNSFASVRDAGGGRITVRLSKEPGRAVVRVCDDGPPIDGRVGASLFEPLRSTKTQGLGLGLPIARALARAMRGELSLEPSRSKTFRLELPLREAIP